MYASRTVIKNQFYNKNVTPGFYGCDVWAEADKIVKPCLSKGMTVYYEIVGFLPNGGYPAKLIILTGREDTPEIRKATEEWLENNFLHPDILLMRPAKSFIAGPVCKKKLYEDNVKGKFYIPFVLEDNAKCGAMKA